MPCTVDQKVNLLLNALRECVGIKVDHDALLTAFLKLVGVTLLLLLLLQLVLFLPFHSHNPTMIISLVRGHVSGTAR